MSEQKSEQKFDRKLKHLDHIQNVITRMNANSFLIKGWTVTLVAALFALADKTKEQHLYLIAFIPVPVFWLLDGFFLATERRFRDLYKKVAKTEELHIDFDMNPYHDIKLIKIKEHESWYSANSFSNWWKLNLNKFFTWLLSSFSITLIIFYGTLVIVMYVVKTWLNV